MKLKIIKNMWKVKDYYVYIIASKTGTLYIGITNDLARRIYDHKNNLVDGFSKKYFCHKLVYYEQSIDINVAISREKQLKKMEKRKERKFNKNDESFLGRFKFRIKFLCQRSFLLKI